MALELAMKRRLWPANDPGKPFKKCLSREGLVGVEERGSEGVCEYSSTQRRDP
jgi:hypothetical protein